MDEYLCVVMVFDYDDLISYRAFKDKKSADEYKTLADNAGYKAYSNVTEIYDDECLKDTCYLIQCGIILNNKNDLTLEIDKLKTHLDFAPSTLPSVTFNSDIFLNEMHFTIYTCKDLSEEYIKALLKKINNKRFELIKETTLLDRYVIQSELTFFILDELKRED